jgi:abortive infection bacteriophage resistance protein
MLFEELTFWEVVNIYKILKKEYKKNIIKNYNSDLADFWTRLILLKKLRNISAHYWRLWNNEYDVWLKTEDKVFWSLFQKRIVKNFENEAIANYYNSSLIVNYLLKHININLWWLSDLENLFNEYKEISIEKMWFIENWKEKFE